MAKQAILERDMLDWAIKTAEAFGWRAWHVPAPMVAGKGEWRPYKRAAGLPDLFLLHDDPPRMMIVEVKGSRGKLSDAQIEFLKLARDVAEAPLQARPGWVGIGSIAEMIEKTMGVYVLEPGNEDAFEAMLRTRVLT